ncbi:MAG: DedA family protein [Beijerinckiaceae bacterium]
MARRRREKNVDINSIVQPILEFARTHPEYAIVIVFLISFGECFAFLSWLVPGTVFFVAFGTVAGAANLGLIQLSISAACGAALGFYVSYLLGRYLGPAAHHTWPFRSNPAVLDRGHAFFEKWGAPAIFIGHFFGPVRAIIALIAGIVEMPQAPFHFANIAASTIWGFAMFYGAGKFGELANQYLGFLH